MHDDGLAYVKEADWPSVVDENNVPRLQMASGLAAIPDDLLEATIEAAEECPGECIFIV